MSGRSADPRAGARRSRPAARDVLVEAGAGTGKTGVMVDRYCRLVCDQGVSPDAVLAFTFTDKAAAELRQRIRAALELRADAGSRARARAAAGARRRLGDDDPRLLQPAARRPPGGRRDRPPLPRPRRARGRARGARGLRRRPGGVPRRRRARTRERTVAAFEIGGLRAIVDRRPRRAAQPRRRRAAPARAAAAGPRGRASRRAAAVAAETLEELKPANSSRELVERALERARRRRATPSLDELAALRTDSKAKAMAAYREAIDAAVAARAEAGEGGDAYRHIGELLDALLGGASRRPRSGAAGLDFEDLQLLAVAPARADGDRRRLPGALQPPAGRRVPGHQPAAAAADRGAARAARPS